MVVGIIGILAAVAIPAYNNYTNRASRGVTESALLAASRQVNLNKSTGDPTTKTDLDADITSKGKALNFVVADGNADSIAPGAAAWCIAVDIDDAGDKYQTACINKAGDITFKTPTGVACSSYVNNKSSCDANFCTFTPHATIPGDGTCVSSTGVCADAGTCG
ncbi:MAG: type IV pilin protein [Bdellovibrionales bacterium]